jgi:hypothetical protein
MNFDVKQKPERKNKVSWNFSYNIIAYPIFNKEKRTVPSWEGRGVGQ